jgi:hypothetical protein
VIVAFQRRELVRLVDRHDSDTLSQFLEVRQKILNLPGAKDAPKRSRGNVATNKSNGHFFFLVFGTGARKLLLHDEVMVTTVCH